MYALVNCPACQRPLRLPESARGKMALCPLCKGKFIVPAAEAVPEAAPAKPKPAPAARAAEDVPAAPRRAAAREEGYVRSEEGRRRPAAGKSAEEPLLVEEAVDDDRGRRDYPPLVLKVQVRKDPEGELKGLLDGEVTAKGLRLRPKKGPVVLLRPGCGAEYLGGNRLELTVEDRAVEVALIKRAAYQQRLARDVAAFLNGRRGPLDPADYRIQWWLLVAALLPVGIPVVSLGGWLWVVAACALVGASLAIIQREEWSAAVRGLAAFGLAALGYGTWFTVLMVVLFLRWQKEADQRAQAAASAPKPVQVPPAGGPAQPPGAQNPPFVPPQQPPQPVLKKDDLKFAARIDTLLSVVTDAESGTALVTTKDGSLQRYSYPGWELKATYKLEKPAYRAALDSGRGLLYLAMSDPQSLVVFHYARREGGVGDLHVYDVKDVLKGKAAEGPLRPAKVLPLKAHVRHLIVSPDRSGLYYLSWSGIGADAYYKPNWSRVGRIDLARQEKGPEVEVKDANPVTCLCLSPDGRGLYAGATGRFRALDPATLQTVKTFPYEPNAEDAAATDGGLLFVTAGGQWTEVRVVDANKDGQVVGKWGSGVTGWTYLTLSPDRKRLYVGGDNKIRSLLVTGDLTKGPPELGEATTSDTGKVQGEFFLTEDGKFVVNRWGMVYRLAQGDGVFERPK